MKEKEISEENLLDKIDFSKLKTSVISVVKITRSCYRVNNNDEETTLDLINQEQKKIDEFAQKNEYLTRYESKNTLKIKSFRLATFKEDFDK